MRVLVLGGTGSIGSAIVDELLSAGHDVVGLARSEAAAESLSAKGASILRGDIREPAGWARIAAEVDGIIHAAGTFTREMVGIDRRLVTSLIDAAGRALTPPRFVYTGGCWLYGETGDTVATEETPFAPFEPFAWMVEHGEWVTASPHVVGTIVHPAMTYERDGGVFGRFADEAKAGGPIGIVGSALTRWPLVHRADLAVLYRLVLEQGARGSSYIGAAEPGVRVGDVVRVVSDRYGLPSAALVRSVDEVVAELGDWAAGLGLDQQLSGRKAREALAWDPGFNDAVGLMS